GQRLASVILICMDCARNDAETTNESEDEEARIGPKPPQSNHPQTTLKQTLNSSRSSNTLKRFKQPRV
ncbi:hypothetical protein, partial [Paraburkholderia aromaticivorans]|uniref:hypothetical protein n=1 Tax=Paraburkholderia aromaticivorans TaxID=2026199 RepID=UPI0038BB2D66